MHTCMQARARFLKRDRFSRKIWKNWGRVAWWTELHIARKCNASVTFIFVLVCWNYQNLEYKCNASVTFIFVLVCWNYQNLEYKCNASVTFIFVLVCWNYQNLEYKCNASVTFIFVLVCWNYQNLEYKCNASVIFIFVLVCWNYQNLEYKCNACHLHFCTSLLKLPEFGIQIISIRFIWCKIASEKFFLEAKSWEVDIQLTIVHCYFASLLKFNRWIKFGQRYVTLLPSSSTLL